MENNWNNISYFSWPIQSMISVYKKHQIWLKRYLRFFFRSKSSNCSVHSTLAAQLSSDSQVLSEAPVASGRHLGWNRVTFVFDNVWLSEVLPTSAKYLGLSKYKQWTGKMDRLFYLSGSISTPCQFQLSWAPHGHSLSASLTLPWIRPSWFLTYTVTGPTCAPYLPSLPIPCYLHPAQFTVTWGPLSHLPMVVFFLPEYLSIPWQWKTREWKS